MTLKSDIRAEADRLRAGFEARGAEVFEAEILQPAGALLNLYGEDIRARAFVTHDPLRGEMMLRPDFTVPLVQRHIEATRAEARYTYAGEVFRRQEDDDTRPTEYIQVGYEVFGDDKANADAEVFAAVREALEGLPLRPAIGDLGILKAAVEDLNTPNRRKAALIRHLWRPARFLALLDRFARVAPLPPGAANADTPHVGLRSLEEVSTRLALLAEEADTPPIPAAEVDRLNAIFAIAANAPTALEKMRGLADPSTALASALDSFDARLGALEKQGIEPQSLAFEASYGRTTLEYYSGFVFGFSAPEVAALPVVATGGRYDMLTAALGHGSALPAVGGVIRPEAVLALRGLGA
ncbi:MAG: ATP phosphoribosyltransferase regulatory subunit [Boseongicola sp.]